MNNYTLLSQRCQKKDKRAQLEFYQLFYKSVYNSCLRILNNPQEAEEIMQECLLKPLDQPEYLLEDKMEMEKENCYKIVRYYKYTTKFTNRFTEEQSKPYG